MKREKLIQYLDNAPLVRAIESKATIDMYKSKMRKMLVDMRQISGMCDGVAYSEIESKLNEYRQISQNYGIFLEDTFGVTWHVERVIKKYLEYADNTGSLPDYINTN